MKRIILSTLLIGLMFSACKKEEDTSKNINIPDAEFKAILLADSVINTNGDEEISEMEASSFTGTLSCQNSDIESAEGIQYFINATRISFFNSKLKSIDLSKNTKVTQLLLENNELTSIDVSMLTVLTDFKCHTNKLTKANVANGNNMNMTRMELFSNTDLLCIKVDNTSVPVGWIKDSTSIYSTNCQ